jgi:hypothetical protein
VTRLAFHRVFDGPCEAYGTHWLTR